MTDLLTIVTSIWDAVTGTGGLMPMILGTPILLFPVAFVFARKTVGLTKGLLGIGGKRR